MRVVVLGIGNVLLTDEGVGVEAVNALAAQYDLPPEVEVIDGGTSGMDCLDQIADVDHLLIADAMRSGKEPGTITRLANEEINAWFKTKISPHQVGLSDVLATLNFHGILPRNIVLVGVQPASFETHMGLSPTIAAVLPQVVARLVSELEAMGVKPLARAAE